MKPTLPRFGEFIALMAMLSSITALATDAMLPALADMGRELAVTHANDVQLIISTLFLGLACGQLFFGPLSDAWGRKPLIYAGLCLFILGSFLSMLAPNFSLMLIGRWLQGLGAASTRVLTLALIRDCYKGNAMARVVSFMSMIFILVPILAPSLGQAILFIASWHYIFAAFIALALTVLLWFKWRMPETLTPDKRRTISGSNLKQGLITVFTTRSSMIYTVSTGLIFGAFMGYLSTAQQILQGLYGVGTQFALYFASLAAGIGGASFINSRLVMHYGMHTMVKTAISSMALLSGLLVLSTWYYAGQPPLMVLMLMLFFIFSCAGILFGNLNALAMEPLGHLAGLGASVVGSFSMFISIGIAILIGQTYNQTLYPLSLGFFLSACAVSGLMAFVTSQPAPINQHP